MQSANAQLEDDGLGHSVSNAAGKICKVNNNGPSNSQQGEPVEYGSVQDAGEANAAVAKETFPQEPEDSVADVTAPQAHGDRCTSGEHQDLEIGSHAPPAPLYSVFSEQQRKYIVFMVACGGFFSPLSANIYFPALNSLSRDLGVSSALINLSLTTYMIFQGLAPTIFGDLADMIGRRPVYLLGFIIYIGANIGLALQNNFAALLVLRCLQSTGSSGTVALGNGVVADIASSGERGRFMGMRATLESLVIR